MMISAGRAIAVMLESHPIQKNPFSGKPSCFCGDALPFDRHSSHIAELIVERFGLQDVEVPIQ
jgi:hypothetical protein